MLHASQEIVSPPPEHRTNTAGKRIRSRSNHHPADPDFWIGEQVCGSRKRRGDHHAASQPLKDTKGDELTHRLG